MLESNLNDGEEVNWWMICFLRHTHFIMLSHLPSFWSWGQFVFLLMFCPLCVDAMTVLVCYVLWPFFCVAQSWQSWCQLI